MYLKRVQVGKEMGWMNWLTTAHNYHQLVWAPKHPPVALSVFPNLLDFTRILHLHQTLHSSNNRQPLELG